MSNINKYTPKDEAELHTLIIKDIDNLEEGMNKIQHEINLHGNIPDILCVDSGSRLSIIEIKLDEDRNVLFQGLRYYTEVERLRWQLANIYKASKIDPNQDPRIILIAQSFTEETKRMCMHIKPTIDLYEYSTILDSNNEIGTIFNSVPIPVEQTIPEIKTIDDFKNYIKKQDLKVIFEDTRASVKEINEKIEEYCTQSYVGYKYKKKQIAWIKTKRTEIEFGVLIREGRNRVEDYPKLTIKNEGYNKKEYQDLITNIRNSINVLK